MKKYLYALVVAALGVGALYFLMWSMRLGDYAESPQRLLLTRTTNRIAAGGKAGLLYEGKYRTSQARILVRCRRTAELLRLREGEESEEICGVYVTLEELRSETEAFVQVRWDD